jgi:hypothetical protein
LSRTPAPLRPTVTFTVAIIAILVLFRLVDAVIGRLGTLPAKAYQGAMFLDDLPNRWLQLASRLPWWLTAAGIASLAVVAAVDHRRFGGRARSRAAALFGGWNELEDGAAVRWLIFAITGVVTWSLTLYPRNLYFGQLHLADRILLLLAWMAILWRPVFVFSFAIVAAAVAGQLFIPLGFNIWAEMGVLMRFPLLFGAFWIVRSFTGERRTDAFIFVWCCLVATTYWTSGFGKLRIGWPSHPHVPLLLLAAHANGWLAGVNTALIERATKVLDRFVLPLMLGTLVVECGSILLLWRRWSLVGFLVVAAVFHIVAFAMTGFWFWRWILADACLVAFLFGRSRLARLDLFTPARFILSVVVIFASPLWVHSENLTWFDTPLTYSLLFDGIDQHGKAHQLPAGAFQPYSEAIVLGAFPAISPYPRLTSPMGITRNRSLAEALVSARAPEDVFRLEATRGTVRPADPAELAAFDDFFGRYAANLRCPVKRDPLLIRMAAPPRHLWTSPLDAALPCDVSLVKVRVTEVTTFFDGKHSRVIRTRVLREVPAADR